MLTLSNCEAQQGAYHKGSKRAPATARLRRVSPALTKAAGLFTATEPIGVKGRQSSFEAESVAVRDGVDGGGVGAFVGTKVGMEVGSSVAGVGAAVGAPVVGIRIFGVLDVEAVSVRCKAGTENVLVAVNEFVSTAVKLVELRSRLLDGLGLGGGIGVCVPFGRLEVNDRLV